MASTINALTSGGGGLTMVGDATGNLNIQSGGSTVVAVTASGATVTGTLAATGAVSGTTGTFTSTLGVTGAITGSSTVAGSTGILYPLTSGTAVASTSGTSIDFTSIPSWVKRITVMFAGVSVNAATHPLIQLGAGSVATTGYLSVSTYSNGAAGAATNSTAGYIINNDAQAVQLMTGTYVFSLLNSSTGLWVGSCVMAFDAITYNIIAGGSKTLSGTLDRVRITTVNGTATFDAGSINILYE